MTINKLSNEIINQISAGEVIENPSAIIKELIENSIDAKSDYIEIIIENAGLKKIQIKDNGIGIEKNDLIKAPIRHATSKIKNFNDLYNIKTMGFRGEALASIFSVSKAEIISKYHKSENSYKITSKNLNEIKLASSDYGTTIIVKDLFYNTPARKKYLKSEIKEFKNIIEIVNRYIIPYNNIKFILKHNNKLIINKPKFKSKLDNLIYIFGNEIKDNLIKIQSEQNGIKLTGYISKPSNLTYPIKKNQFIFVNKRYVKSKLIKDAIYEGFGTNLMEGRHPFYSIEIEIDPEIIDVNVHPTKIEIKFENELEIYNFIRKSIQEIFEKTPTFKPFENQKKEKDFQLTEKINEIKSNYNLNQNLNQNRNKNLNINQNTNNINNNSNNNNKTKTYFNKEIQKELQLNENLEEYNKNEEIKETTNTKINNENKNKIELKKSTSPIPTLKSQISNPQSQNYGPLYERLKEYRILGQINKTFIILETPNEMIMIDQHVAEEKFYFEKFKEELKNKKIQSQKLLKPEIIELTNSEFLLYKDNLNILKKIGFETEEFSGNTIIVRAVPIGIRNKIINANIIKDIIYEITIDNKFKLLEEKQIEKLASISCKKSIKAGHELTKEEIKKIIEQLKKLKEPFNCPHGRPILLNWTFKDLEKKFKRII